MGNWEWGMGPHPPYQTAEDAEDAEGAEFYYNIRIRDSSFEIRGDLCKGKTQKTKRTAWGLKFRIQNLESNREFSGLSVLSG